MYLVLCICNKIIFSVTLCVIKVVYLAGTSPPSDSNAKIPPSINNNSLNGDKDENGNQDDDYKPADEWSDTFDWRLLKVRFTNKQLSSRHNSL